MSTIIDTSTQLIGQIAKRLDKTADDTEALLGRLLSDDILHDEIARPKRLMDAMRYSSLNGGKRLRPFLVVESAAVFGVPREEMRASEVGKKPSRAIARKMRLCP